MNFKLKRIWKAECAFAFFSILAVLALFSSSPRAAVPSSAVERSYKSKCSICHGTDGAGHTAKGKKEKIRDLRSHEVQEQSDAQLTDIITHGKKKMKGFDDRLSPEQIQQLVAYLRELSTKH